MKSSKFIRWILFIVIAIFLFSYFCIIHPIQGDSMKPTVNNNDLVLLKKTDQIERYALIGFELENRQDMMIKRVIGLPGDSYIIAGNQLIFTVKEEDGFNSTNNYELTKEVSEALSNYKKIPENQYFVIGDNRGISNDSRKFGFVNKEEIEGEIIFRLFPFNDIGLLN